MMALADKESSFKPANKAKTSSAEGLFQFIEGTWLQVLKQYGAKHGYAGAADAVEIVKGRVSVSPQNRDWVLSLRRDPYLSALMAGEMVRSYQDMLAGVQSERAVTGTDLYLAHFLGVNGASRFLALMGDKPDQTAPTAFPQAAKANRTLFFGAKDVAKAPEAAKPKAVAKAGPKALTLAEVHALLDTVIDKRMARYERARRDLGKRQVASADPADLSPSE